MNDSYVECLVAHKKSGLLSVLKGVLIVVAVLGFLLSMGGVIIGLIVAVAAGVGAYFAGMYASVEYEYLYVDREITVDRILNKTRRKRIEKFEVDRIEIFAPVKSWHMDNFKNRQYKVTDYSSGVEQQPDKRYAMIYDGGRQILLEPSVELVKAVQSIAPRKVFLD